MKQINNYISEKLIINKDIKSTHYNYHPKTKGELEELIDKLIKERGNEADLNDIDTSKITYMARLFKGSDFDGNISDWDVSNVTNMNWMFSHCKFTGKNSNLNKWDVSKVKLMNGMFYCGMFKGNIDDWTPPKDFKYNLIFKESPLYNKPPKWYSSK